jgi:hypothetical protein
VLLQGVEKKEMIEQKKKSIIMALYSIEQERSKL